MGEDTGQIEREIATHRRELGQNLSALENKAKALTDWREYYREKPGLFLGVALGGGLLLGAIVSGGRSSSSARSRLVDVDSPRTSGLRHRAGRQVDDTWQHVSDALLGIASAKVVEFVGGLVPGFHDHYKGPTSGPTRVHYPRDREPSVQ